MVSLGLRLVLLSAIPSVIYCLSSSASSSSSSNKKQSIMDAKMQSMVSNKPVTIVGYVTIPSGQFNSNLFDERFDRSDEGFAIQDNTAGIYVKTESNLGLALGEKVKIKGIIKKIFGIKALVPDVNNYDKNVKQIANGQNKLFEPQLVELNGVNDLNEGSIISIIGNLKSIENELPYGFELVFENSRGHTLNAFINDSTDIDVNNQFIIGNCYQITGISSGFIFGSANSREIQPRFATDVQSSNACK